MLFTLPTTPHCLNPKTIPADLQFQRFYAFSFWYCLPSKVELILLNMYITGSSKLHSKVSGVQQQRITFECNYSASGNWFQLKRMTRLPARMPALGTLLLRKDMRTYVREGHALSHLKVDTFKFPGMFQHDKEMP